MSSDDNGDMEVMSCKPKSSLICKENSQPIHASSVLLVDCFDNGSIYVDKS